MNGQPAVPLPTGSSGRQSGTAEPIQRASDDVNVATTRIRCGHCAAPASARVTYRVTDGTRTTLVCGGHIAGVTLATKVERKCSYCGRFDETTATHSGVDECRLCWNYRELDRPAAQHWAEVAQTFLSNVDYHDMTDFLPKALEIVKNGRGEPVTVTWDQLLCGAQAVMLHSQRLLEQGPPHTWKEEEK